MSFTVREATIKDAGNILELTIDFHKESTLNNDLFKNNLDDFISDCFKENPKANFFIAEFQDNILGYCAYYHSFNVISGSDIIIPEIYIKPEYRGLGVAIFLYSYVFDIAYKNDSSEIKWLINLQDKRIIETKMMGVFINMDDLVVSISKESMEIYLKLIPKESLYNTRFLKTYELPILFDFIQELAISEKKEIKTDIYKLLDVIFSSIPKIKIIVVTDNDEIVGFLSFFEGYYSSGYNNIIIDTIYTIDEDKELKIRQALFLNLGGYVCDNNYSRIESRVSKFEVERIETLKEYNIFPYNNIRIASYKRTEFEKFYKTKKK